MLLLLLQGKFRTTLAGSIAVERYRNRVWSWCNSTGRYIRSISIIEANKSLKVTAGTQ